MGVRIDDKRNKHPAVFTAAGQAGRITGIHAAINAVKAASAATCCMVGIDYCNGGFAVSVFIINSDL